MKSIDLDDLILGVMMLDVCIVFFGVCIYGMHVSALMMLGY